MRRRKHSRPIWRSVIGLILIPLAVMSAGYALYSQNLSVSGTANRRPTNLTPRLVVTYNSYSTGGNNKTYYLNPITITNQGTGAASGWTVTFSLPTGYRNFSCTNATCSVSGRTVTATNQLSNGTILPGQSVSFSAQFSSRQINYTSYSMTVSTQVMPTGGGSILPMPTASIVNTYSWSSGGAYYGDFDVTISNPRTSTLDSWTLSVPFPGGSVWGISGATYTLTGGVLVIQGGPLSAGGSTTVTAYLDYVPSSTWNFDGYSLTGTP